MNEVEEEKGLNETYKSSQSGNMQQSNGSESLVYQRLKQTCYRCNFREANMTKTRYKRPLAEFNCDVGLKSLLRVIRQILIAKISV